MARAHRARGANSAEGFRHCVSLIYVLHVFQKKSRRGRETPQRDIDLIKERLKRAGDLHALKVKESEQ